MKVAKAVHQHVPGKRYIVVFTAARVKAPVFNNTEPLIVPALARIVHRYSRRRRDFEHEVRGFALSIQCISGLCLDEFSVAVSNHQQVRYPYALSRRQRETDWDFTCYRVTFGASAK